MLEKSGTKDLMSQLADVLPPVLQYIAKGSRGGTMAHRAWVVLHETRLDLIEAESMGAYAAREGISARRVMELVTEFRSMVPAYRAPNRASDSTRAKMSAAHRTHAGATP